MAVERDSTGPPDLFLELIPQGIMSRAIETFEAFDRELEANDPDLYRELQEPSDPKVRKVTTDVR